MPATYDDVRIGFEFEHISPWNYNTYPEHLRRDLGLDIGNRGNYEGWSLVGDGSVAPTAGRGGHALELVSPILSLEEGMKRISQIIQWSTLNGGYTNSTCGLHIGVSVRNHMDTFDKISLLLLMDHDQIHRRWGRINNTYCQNLLKGTKLGVKNQALTWETHWQPNVPIIDRIRDCIPVGKYNGANLSKLQMNNPYVEFRAMGGCIDDRIPEVLENIVHYADVMIKSVDPTWKDTPQGRRKIDSLTEEVSELVRTERVAQRAEVERRERAAREARELANRRMAYVMDQRMVGLVNRVAGRSVPNIDLPADIVPVANRAARRAHLQPNNNARVVPVVEQPVPIQAAEDPRPATVIGGPLWEETVSDLTVQELVRHLRTLT